MKKSLQEIQSEIKEVSDPLDKIEIIAGFIRELLISNNTSEVLLASPEFNISEPIEAEYDTDDKIIWFCPHWIDFNTIERDVYFYNKSLWTYTIVVRLGIVGDDVKFTCQEGFAENQDDTSEDDNLECETDWLGLGNIPDADFWFRIATYLTEHREPWVFTAQNPDIMKL